MSKYYVNKNQQSNGDHEVHKSGYSCMPKPENRIFLGSFDKCEDAVREATKRGYKRANGCYYCCRECHTS